MRYRHSVGSPSLLMSDTIRPVTEVLQRTPNPEPLMLHSVESHDISNFENYCYGDEEVERFFANDLSFDQEPTEPSSPQQLNSLLHTEEVTISQSKVLEELRTFYSDTCTKLNSKTIIVQRNIERFDFREHNINVIFAGEAAPDAGGPHYEFLTLRMRNFTSHPVVYRTQNVFFFQKFTVGLPVKSLFYVRTIDSIKYYENSSWTRMFE